MIRKKRLWTTQFENPVTKKGGNAQKGYLFKLYCLLPNIILIIQVTLNYLSQFCLLINWFFDLIPSSFRYLLFVSNYLLVYA